MINWEQKTKTLLRAVYEDNTADMIEEFGIHVLVEMAVEVIDAALDANAELHRALDESVGEASAAEEQVAEKKYQEHIAAMAALERMDREELNDSWFSEKPKVDE